MSWKAKEKQVSQAAVDAFLRRQKQAQVNEAMKRLEDKQRILEARAAARKRKKPTATRTPILPDFSEPLPAFEPSEGQKSVLKLKERAKSEANFDVRPPSSGDLEKRLPRTTKDPKNIVPKFEVKRILSKAPPTRIVDVIKEPPIYKHIIKASKSSASDSGEDRFSGKGKRLKRKTKRKLSAKLEIDRPMTQLEKDQLERLGSVAKFNDWLKYGQVPLESKPPTKKEVEQYQKRDRERAALEMMKQVTRTQPSSSSRYTAAAQQRSRKPVPAATAAMSVSGAAKSNLSGAPSVLRVQASKAMQRPVVTKLTRSDPAAHMPLKRDRLLLVSSSSGDEDDDLSDFIADDDDDVGMEMEGEAGRELSDTLKQVFGYDKSRYKNESSSDLRNMVSSYSEISKEEQISTKIAHQEDLAEMREERRREMLKAKRRKIA